MSVEKLLEPSWIIVYPGKENFAINRRVGGSFAFCIEGLAPQSSIRNEVFYNRLPASVLKAMNLKKELFLRKLYKDKDMRRQIEGGSRNNLNSKY